MREDYESCPVRCERTEAQWVQWVVEHLHEYAEPDATEEDLETWRQRLLFISPSVKQEILRAPPRPSKSSPAVPLGATMETVAPVHNIENYMTTFEALQNNRLVKLYDKLDRAAKLIGELKEADRMNQANVASRLSVVLPEYQRLKAIEARIVKRRGRLVGQGKDHLVSFFDYLLTGIR